MKAKMIIRYKRAPFFILICALLFLLLGVMAFTFITEDKNYGLATLCFALITLIFVAMYFRFNYGIRISEKRVIAIEQGKMKILKYDDVSSITIKFTNEKIIAYIKMKSHKEYTFVWDHVFLGSNVFLPSKLNIALDDKFVTKSIESLSICDKVKIQNFYTPRG